MKEADFLQIVSFAVSGVVSSPEIDPTTPIQSVTNMAQKVFITDTTKAPQTGDIFTVYYYVKNRGADNEEAFFSEVRNHSSIVAAINAYISQG